MVLTRRNGRSGKPGHGEEGSHVDCAARARAHARTRGLILGFGFTHLIMTPFLRYDLQDMGDERLSGQRLYDFRESKSFDGVLSSLVGRHTDKITVQFMAPSVDPKLQQQSLSRMVCTKQIFHALVNRMSAYQMQVYGNCDILLDHSPRSFKLCNAQHAPRAVIYLVPMLIMC